MKMFSLAKSLCFDKKVNGALYLTLQVIVNILLHTGLSLCSSSGYKVIQLCMCLNMILKKLHSFIFVLRLVIDFVFYFLMSDRYK